MSTVDEGPDAIANLAISEGTRAPGNTSTECIPLGRGGRPMSNKAGERLRQITIEFSSTQARLGVVHVSGRRGAGPHDVPREPKLAKVLRESVAHSPAQS